MMHMTDWMPTFLKLAGFKGNSTKQLNLDGVNQWNTINKNKRDSRTELVYNIKDDEGAIRVGDYKLLYGKPSLLGWYKTDIMPVKCLKWMKSVPPTKGVKKAKLKQKFSQAWDNRFESKYRREYRRWMRENGAIAPRNIRTDDCSGRAGLVEIIHRPNKTLESFELNEDNENLDDDESAIDQGLIEPEEPSYNPALLEKLKFVNWTEILETSPIYLFNLRTDPLETDNLADRHPDIVQQLKNRLMFHIGSITLPDSVPEDRRGHPKNFNNNLGTGWCVPK